MKILKLLIDLSMAKLVMIAVILTAAYFFLYYDNGALVEQQISDAKSQLDVVKNKRSEIEKKMKKEEEMRGNLLQLARNLDIVKSKIPNEFNEIEISSILNKISTSTQVKITSLKRYDCLNLAKISKNITGAELIDEICFNIEFLGTFNNILSFVEFLSKEEKTLKIRNFIIEKNNPKNFTDDAIIKFVGEIVGYKQSAVAINAPKTNENVPKPGEK